MPPRKPTAGRRRKRPERMEGGQTKAALAAAVGISTQLLNGYLERGCPPGPPPVVVRWISEHVDATKSSKLRGKAGGNRTEGLTAAQWQARKQRAEARKVEAQVKKLRLEYAQARKEVVALDLVERLFGELLIETRGRFEAIPEEMRMRFPLAQRQALVDELRHLIEFQLRRLAAWRPSFADEDEPAETPTRPAGGSPAGDFDPEKPE